MAKAYSNDLRDKVLAYYDNETTQAQTCEVFGIARSTLNNWLRLRRETGSGHGRPRATITPHKIDPTGVRQYVKKHPDAYLREIAAAFGVSPSAIWYACEREKITRKKRVPATENAIRRSEHPSSMS